MLFNGEVPDPEQELVAFGPEEQQWWTTTGLRKKKAASVLQLKVDSLLVASKADPVSITKLVFPYLCDSGCFAIFGPSLDVLKELYVWLRDANNAVNLEISETYLQHHQVLPLRTHPMMSGTANSGYVLSGIKVASL
jgi:tRNA (adenine-N(1)-)-methyltransferase non-catalytic subunit